MRTKESRSIPGIGSLHWAEGTRARALDCGMALLLAALCASAQLFGRASPLGVAIVAATGASLAGFFALVGAAAGYLFFEGTAQGLPYVAAAVLLFGISFALHDTRISRRPASLPTLAAALVLVCRFVALRGTGFFGAELIYLLSEPLFAFGAALLYREAAQLRGRDDKFSDWPLSLQAGAAAFVATLLLALSSVLLWGDFSVGRIVATAGLLLLARLGPKTGLLLGCCTGLLLDLASGKGPYYCMAYALGAAAAGAAAKRGRIAAALCFLAASALAVLWTWDSGLRIPLLYEVAAAALLFLLLPKRLWERSAKLLALPAQTGGTWDGTRERAVRQVRETAKAFRGIYDSLREGLRPDPGTSEDPHIIFSRAAERECRKCQLRELCWQDDYQSTQQILGDALKSMTARGRVESEDFPPYFRSRCIHFPGFLEGVGEELRAYLYRRSYRGKLSQSRAALCRQYAELDSILQNAALELSVDLTPDLPRTNRLRTWLHTEGFPEDCRAYFDARGHLQIELGPIVYLRTEEGRARLSALMNLPLRAAEELPDGRLLFGQSEPLQAKAGIFGRSKAGQTQSGDTGSWFRREDGLLCILLCDGMGSGEAARAESALAVRLLEGFLKAGVAPDTALRTVNAALCLRGEAGGGCSSVDLLTIELYGGSSSVYKLGAAPSYHYSGSRLRVLSASSLPAGLETQEDLPHESFRVQAGDWILLLSDGVLPQDDDSWLRECLSSYEGTSPGELAEKVLSASLSHSEGSDDATVIAVRLDARG